MGHHDHENCACIQILCLFDIPRHICRLSGHQSHLYRPPTQVPGVSTGVPQLLPDCCKVILQHNLEKSWFFNSSWNNVTNPTKCNHVHTKWSIFTRVNQFSVRRTSLFSPSCENNATVSMFIFFKKRRNIESKRLIRITCFYDSLTD